MLARLLYALLWIPALPLALLRLLWRARRQPDYLRDLGQRFGRYPVAPAQPLIWVHAVSVGETRAAEPLVRGLLARWPDHQVVLSAMTPTGRATAQQLFANEARVHSVYLPYDLGWCVSRFLDWFNPEFGVIMETELWPNLLVHCRRRGIPVILANARLSGRSARRYARVPALTRLTLEQITAFACQTEEDGARLRALGARGVHITGNIKFDLQPPADLAQRVDSLRARVGSRRVVLLASTREGEEAPLLDAFIAAQPAADILLVIVPRHPQRFDEVAGLVRSRGLACPRRSDGQTVLAGEQVWLGDSMGEMSAYYALAGVALIGGSWEPLGGQNLIEACAVGTPVVIGPHTWNFSVVAENAVSVGAALRAPDPNEGMARALALLDDAPQHAAMRQAGLAFAQAHRGATERTLALISAQVGAPGSTSVLQ